MAHVLVVGGTGMLRNVSLFLAKYDNTVSVVGLEEQDLFDLTEQAQTFNGRIHAIQVDYRDADAFRQALEQAMNTHGPITLALAWMYTDALPGAANTAAEVISAHSPVCRYFQVLPSTGITGKDRRFLENPFPHLDKIFYRKIILGFRVENGMSRWLTNDEISSGVIEALRDDERDAVVGVVDPHEAHPRTA